MNLIEAVKNWGLNDKEAKVYLALLQLGLTTAYNVANKSGLKKPTTYVILEQLQEKGMVRKIPRAKKLLFEAETPEHIWRIVDERMLWAKRALPELLAVKKERGKKVSVAYYEGLSGLKQIYGFVINTMREKNQAERKYVGFFGNEVDASKEVLDYFLEVNSAHEKYKIKRRALTSFHPKIIEKYLNNEVLEKYNINVKAIRIDKYNSNLEIMILDDSVAIVSQRYLFGVIFRNADMATIFRQLFEMIWDLVEKDRKSYLGYSNIGK
ncbi:MAG: helix-turn-helix domain-containing protein [Parcubacteria group bacterium]|jgi:sugar-specific transcriptional regulator TrmB